MDRIKTGIQGLDKALNGGFPAGNLVLVSGGAGTGKSTLSLQFLVNGASLFGERGLYISTEQTVDELKRHASSFGWDIDGLIGKNLLKLVYFDITGGDDFLHKVDDLVQQFKPKRIAVDSMTTLTDALLISGIGENEAFSLVQVAESVSPIPRTERVVAKSILYQLIKELKKFKVTTLLTSELLEEYKGLSADGISEFITDGVIVLNSLVVGDQLNRTIQIRKMRYSAMDGGSKSYDIGDNGISFE